MSEDIYVTRAEAAAILHCTPSTVARYDRKGRLTRYYRGGTQTVIYLRDEVLALVRPARGELRMRTVGKVTTTHYRDIN